MSRSVEHKKDIKLNREKLQEILNSQKMGYIELHEKASQRYGLDLQYKGFMSLMSNKSSWKLLYAHAIADVLKVNYNDIFEIVDVEKKN
ncbi:hypothetical protein PQE66_gp077 [Bacillus phage PBC2]|uniref:Uncharacterized protein n=1 Tax=Bacillus phage PBC2 TaxID=1675029 RepID=A0A218KBX5_9CAUD|nr:hypothetical protein PQE66_gp077 [Bacillus phage PBC2]AKQ08392.1 hypothetical protein PBC2_077 [Bacillus phage PBC2]